MSTASLRRALVPLTAVGCLWLTACGSNDQALDPSGSVSDAQTPSVSSMPVDSPTVETSPSVSPTPSVDPNALITLDQPTSGAVVSGSFKVSGKANSPEANVPWSIKDASGEVVKKGYFTAEGWRDKLYPYAGTVKLSGLGAGDYTFEVRVDDESDGEAKDTELVDVPITVQ